MILIIGLSVAMLFLALSFGYCGRQTLRSAAVEMRWLDALAFAMSGFSLWAVSRALYIAWVS